MARTPLSHRLAERFGLVPQSVLRREVREARKRAFSFAAQNRLTADWVTAHLSGDAELRGPIRRILSRARDLAHENDYVRGFLADCETNIIGSADFDMRMDTGDPTAEGKRPDKVANSIIEGAWADWNKPQNASASGAIDWRGIKRQALRDVPIAGAVLFRHIRGAEAGNPYGYAVQLLEIEHLDFDRNEDGRNGSKIRFGIESDAFGRKLAYHIYPSHPGDRQSTPASRDTIRVPASDMGLLQIPERISQSLSFSWLVSAGKSLHMLDGYEDAELIASRAAACKGGFFESPVGSAVGYPEADETGEKLEIDAEPGVWEALPAGVKAVQNDPVHPTSQFAEFRKAVLRRIATALGISYTTLGNDLEAVNFSSARVGLMDEREVWKALQLWFRVYFLEPVFAEWLTMALSVGAINLPVSKFAKFNHPRFKPRRWDWLEPLKDAQAKTLEVESGFTSRRAVIDERGGDIEIVFADQAADAALAEDKGLNFAGKPVPQQPGMTEPGPAGTEPAT